MPRPKGSANKIKKDIDSVVSGVDKVADKPKKKEFSCP